MNVIVYTAILGDSDSLKPAPKGVRAICYVDAAHRYNDPQGWEFAPVHYQGDPRREAWRLRCVPHELFPAYDRVVWIDASYALHDVPRLIRDAGTAPIAALRHHKRASVYAEGAEIVKVGQAPRADVDRQLATYRSEGFHPNHLSVSCILVRTGASLVREFNDTWDEQIQRHRGDNTQLSLDYAAWKHGLTIHALKGSRLDNPYATHDAKDHKRRRRPYDTEAA